MIYAPGTMGDLNLNCLRCCAHEKRDGYQYRRVLRDTFLTVVELRQGTTVRHVWSCIATASGRWNWSANA